MQRKMSIILFNCLFRIRNYTITFIFIISPWTIRELFILLFVSDHDSWHRSTAVTPQLPRTVGLGSSNPASKHIFRLQSGLNKLLCSHSNFWVMRNHHWEISLHHRDTVKEEISSQPHLIKQYTEDLYNIVIFYEDHLRPYTSRFKEIKL